MNRKERRATQNQKNGITDLQKICDDALKCHQLGDLRQAQQLYTRAVSIKSDIPELHNNLGILLKELGEFDAAEQSFEQALKLKACADFTNNLCITLKMHAQTLANQGRPKEAAVKYEQVLAHKPNDAITMNNLANIMRSLRNFDMAVSFYMHAIDQKPDFAEAYNNLGLALKDQGKLESAETQYQKAIILKPNLIEAYVNLGVVQLAQKKAKEAAEVLAQVLICNPDYAEAHYQIGIAYRDLQQVDKAISHLECYLQLDSADIKGARLLLSALGAEAIPDRASEGFLQVLYGQRAGFWDEENCGSYRGHELVEKAFENLWGNKGKADILDIGCGTGLVGELLYKYAQKLEGVDLSRSMLEKARSKQIYHALYEDDLVAFLGHHQDEYDAITCAATLIHFGNLMPIFNVSYNALRKGGFLVATLFPGENKNSFAPASYPGLAQGGCYEHGEGYLRTIAKEVGFSFEILETCLHEYDKERPISGLVIGLRKPI